MKITEFTERDLEIHNRTAAILPDEPIDPNVDLTTVEGKEDSYNISELVFILEVSDSFRVLMPPLKNTIARETYGALRNYFRSIADKSVLEDNRRRIDILEFENKGLEIKINKLKENNKQLGEALEISVKENGELASSKKMLHAKVIEVTKLVKKYEKLVQLKNKVIMRLATRLVMKC